MPRLSDRPRDRISRAAAELLAQDGAAAVTTRAVSAAANVNSPTIYRQFGDMQGLLLAAAQDTFAEYVRDKANLQPSADPVSDLRRGWDLHVTFGLKNPDAFKILFGASSTSAHVSLHAGHAVLAAIIERIADGGALRLAVPQAVDLVHAAATGVTLMLIATPSGKAEISLSEAMREAVLTAILLRHGFRPSSQERQRDQIAARASALKAALTPGTGPLSPTEQALFIDWLDRLASPSPEAHPLSAT